MPGVSGAYVAGIYWPFACAACHWSADNSRFLQITRELEQARPGFTDFLLRASKVDTDLATKQAMEVVPRTVRVKGHIKAYHTDSPNF